MTDFSIRLDAVLTSRLVLVFPPAGSCPFTARSPGGISPVHVARLLICLKDTKWDRTQLNRLCGNTKANQWQTLARIQCLKNGFLRMIYCLTKILNYLFHTVGLTQCKSEVTRSINPSTLKLFARSPWHSRSERYFKHNCFTSSALKVERTNSENKRDLVMMP